MKSIFKKIFMVFLMLPILNLSSCDKQKNDTEKSSLLWKITWGEKKSYVFGTIHIPYKGFEKIPQPVLDGIKSSETIFTEMEPDEKGQIEISRGMNLPGDQTLKGLIGDELFERLANVCSRFEPAISPAFLNTKKIWAAILITSYRRGSYDLTLDVLLYEKARLLGKKSAGIEKPSEQISTLDSFSQDEQIEMLKDSLKEAESGFTTVDSLLKEYLMQDVSKMIQTFIDKDDEYSPELKEKYIRILLTERNRLFFKRLKDQFKTQNIFVAVGAGHLAGEDNLLQMLRDDGFQVEPVEFNFECADNFSGREIFQFLDFRGGLN